MILRELAARYDLKFNDKAFKKADKTVNTMMGTLRTLGGVLAAGAVARGFFKLIGLASDAEETLNVLNESFGDNVETVKAWAADMAQEMGRSEFQLREMAGTLGAILNPMMERNADVAAEMSTRLAGLAVDLGSFFNATDEEALAALRSGIAGMSKPLLRFGVVMLEATLQQFALSQGITKSVKNMTVAEKTMLRYQFILDQTQNAQGDAARTAQGYANASKALKTALRDLGTQIGMQALPMVRKLTGGLRDGVRWFGKFLKGTDATQHALLSLGVSAVAVAAKLLTSYSKMLLPFIKWAIIVGVAFLVFDELITLFKGGDTVIGRFIDKIFGPGSAAEAVDKLTEAGRGLVFVYKEQVVPAIEDAGAAFWEMRNNAEASQTKLGGFVRWLEKDFKTGIEGITSTFVVFVDTVKLAGEWVGYLAFKLFQVSEWIKETTPDVKSFVGNLGLERPARNDQESPPPERPARRQLPAEARGGRRRRGLTAEMLGAAPRGPAPQVPRMARPAVRPAAAGAQVNQTNNVNINVTAPPGSSAQNIGAEIERRINEATKKQNRAALQAVKQHIESGGA